MKTRKKTRRAFSLIEVALAMGLTFFGLVAVIGLIPSGLDATRAAIDETRAAQMAQRLFAEFQAQNFTAVTLPLYDGTGTFVKNASTPFNLSALTTASPAAAFTANNNGDIMFAEGGTSWFIDAPSQPADKTARYNIAVRFDNAPAGMDAGDPARKYANKLTVRVSWDQRAGASVSTARQFFYGDFTGVITKY